MMTMDWPKRGGNISGDGVHVERAVVKQAVDRNTNLRVRVGLCYGADERG